MTRPKRILRIALFNFFGIAACVGLYSFTKASLFVYVPFVLSSFLLFFAPLETTPGVLLGYVTFDGMLKILGGYTPLLHVAADLLALFLTVRWLLILGFPAKQWRRKWPPFLALFAVHVAWMTIEIANPYGIGLLPGIAAYKIYASYLTLFFFTYMSLDDPEELGALVIACLFILGFESVLSAVQFARGDQALLALSRNYTVPLQNRFYGVNFRPFGTSTSPGGASQLFYLILPLATGLMMGDKGFWKKATLAGLMLLTGYGLFISQVRSSIIKALAGIAFTGFVVAWRRPRMLAAGVLTAVALFATFHVLMNVHDPALAIAQKRYNSIFDFHTIENARGQGVVESIEYLLTNAPFGIGLSRVGASGREFMNAIASNPYYGPEWSFADNLYKALMIELGLPGMLFYLAFAFAPFLLVSYRILKAERPRFEVLCLVAGCAGLAAASIAGHWGTEASLYLPESAYYWVFLGAGVKFSERRFLGNDYAKS